MRSMKPSLDAVRQQVLRLNEMLGIQTAKRVARKKQRPRNQLRHKFLQHMMSDPSKKWKTSEFRRFARQPGLASTTLFNMMQSGQVRRTGDAEYQLTAEGRKQARAIE
jgi:hypothetical protein